VCRLPLRARIMAAGCWAREDGGVSPALHPAGAQRRSEPWWVGAFGEDYPRAYASRDLAEARGQVPWLLSLGLRGPVLDLGCGWGRHVAALRESGIEAFGVDGSGPLLRHASREVGAARSLGRLFQAALEQLPLASGCVPWALSMFTSFGYAGPEGDARILREIARVLQPGGSLLLDLPDPDGVRARLIPCSERWHEGWRLRARRRLVAGGRRVLKVVRARSPEGLGRGWWEEVWLYSREELEGLLQGAGFRVEACFADHAGQAWAPGAERMLILGRREGGRR